MLKKTAIVVGALAAAVFVYVGFFPSRTPAREPIIIHGASTSVERDLEAAIAEADLIVVGKVLAVMPSRWSTPDGKLPPNTTVLTMPTNITMFTETEFKVADILKGNAEGPVIRVRTFGGQVEQDQLIVEDEPSLQAGNEYLLFLVNDTGRTADIGPEHYLTLGTSDLVYRISGESATSARDEWSLEELIQYIRDAVP